MVKHKILDLPKHENPSPARTASAPYNFVPLPEVVVTAVDDANDLPDHDTYANDKYPHTGYFDVTLTTKSPLYVRAPLNADELDEQERGDNPEDFRDQVKNKPYFFFTQNKETPVIPGSSLRGMLRGLLEIVSYGKMQWVTDKQLFYRTVDNTSVGIEYRNRMMGNVEAGYLRKEDGRYFIQVCEMARVPRELLTQNPAELYTRYRRTAVPRWHLPRNVQTSIWVQHKECWVQRNESGWLVTKISAAPFDGGAQARLVLTGDMPNQKLKEFVFLECANDAEEIDVAEEILERFHDDQLTQWQELAFSKDEPHKDARERRGMLRRDLSDGEPVFFLREKDANGNLQLTFFGRAQMFRLPYKTSPRDLVPPQLRDPREIDFAEAIFGFVRTKKELEESGIKAKQGDKRRAYAGRVFVTDAVLTRKYDEKELWLTPRRITPRILATPKPTAFQQYLVQLNDVKDKLTHYDSPTLDDNGKLLSERTTIRGHKLYWHQGERTANDLQENGQVSETQHTQIEPVNKGVTFQFKVYFENLNDAELGALCWTLHPFGGVDAEYCHSFGMGKPLGMGAVKLNATLHLTKRETRYGALFAEGVWASGETAVEELKRREHLETRVTPFEERVLARVQPDRPILHLYELQRIAILLELLKWPGPEHQPLLERVPSRQQNRMLGEIPNTRYMTIRIAEGMRAQDANEYRERPVLSDARAFHKHLDDGAKSTLYGEGTRFTAEVDYEHSDGNVYLKLPAVDASVRYGEIEPAERKGFTFREGEWVRCEVLERVEAIDGAEVILCKPVGE